MCSGWKLVYSTVISNGMGSPKMAVHLTGLSRVVGLSQICCVIQAVKSTWFKAKIFSLWMPYAVLIMLVCETRDPPI